MTNILPSKPTLPSSYSIKHLTYSEMQQLRDQGLCLNCNDIDMSSHRCPVKRIILVLPDEDPDFEQQPRDAPTVPEKLNSQDTSVHMVNHASDLKVDLAGLSEAKWVDARNMFVEMIKPSVLSSQLAILLDATSPPPSTLTLTPPTTPYASNKAAITVSEWADAHYVFVEMKQLLYESKVLVFDPGGTLRVARVFDLEDKVDLEGVGIDTHIYKDLEGSWSNAFLIKPASCCCIFL